MSCQERAQLDFGDRQRPGANRPVDEFPSAAEFSLVGAGLGALAPQFVNLERLCKTLWTNAIDAAEAKASGGALPERRRDEDRGPVVLVQSLQPRGEIHGGASTV